MIVDFHVHVFPPQIKADRSSYLERDAVFRSLYSNPKAKVATADDLLASMDAAGVDVSVMQGFGWATDALCIEHNDYLLEAAARHPDRLIPFCTVQPRSGPAAAEEARRVMAGGARGLGELRPDGQGYGPEVWEAASPLGALAQEQRLPLLFHASEPVGHTYAGKGRMTPDALYALTQALPGHPLVLAHLGGGLPLYAAMPEVREALANTYVDTAAWPLLYGQEVFTALAAVFGTEYILFASDYPLQGQTRAVERIRALPLPPTAIQGILGGNAARLLDLR